MAILRVKDADGNVMAIPAVKGDKGDKGDSGAGVHAGSYVGIAPVDTMISNYIDLGSPHVRAVLLETTSSSKPLVIVTAGEGTQVDGKTAATLISGHQMFAGDNMFLAVHTQQTNQEGVTYHYLAFVEEEAE